MSETNETNASAAGPDSAPDTEHWLHLYEQMVKIRIFEEAANELYTSAKMPGIAHLYIGEEAIAVGICEAMRQDDYITSTHRGHGHCLAKGAALDRMFAELLGKEAGYCRGKGGSMHIADQETGNLGANAIVGGSAGIATGAALSIKLRGTDQVAVCFFGDGALGQGLLYESMNMAQLWKLPVIYVCENNQYGEYTHNSKTARLAIERARKGGGPAFLVCNTYRFRGHHVGDIDRPYRSREEEAEWAKRDPLKLLEDWLLKSKQAETQIFTRIQKDVQTAVDGAVSFALDAPYPSESEVEQHVYA